ncbi:MAG: hypothetical protein HKN23_11470 [Verrucomicrobiales bacterium]|nr:hypothetical protein [Verrucomicrobiales bacterium]
MTIAIILTHPLQIGWTQDNAAKQQQLRIFSQTKKVAEGDPAPLRADDPESVNVLEEAAANGELLAQNQNPPANTPPTATNPPAAATNPPAGTPQVPNAEANPNAGSAIQGDRVTLQFPLNPVGDILAIYERLIGKPIVKDSSVFEGPQVSLVTPADVPRDEAIRLIEAALLVNGYILVAEPDANSVKVLQGGARQGGRSPSFSEGVVIYTNENTLPSGESLVGFFLTLDFINPEEAATIFGNHVVLNEFGRITPVSSPAGLLITETTPIVRQLIKLAQIIDLPAEDAPLLTEFVTLEYAEANVVAQIIQAVMDARMEERLRQSEAGRTISGQQRTQQGQPQQNQPRTPQSSQNRNGQSSNNTATGIGTADAPAAQLIPDDRLGRIMVVATPSDAAYVIDMISEFDQPLSTPDPVERELQHVRANDILPVIVDVLQDTGTGQTQLPGGRQIETRQTPVTSSQLATLTGATTGQQNNQNRVQQGQTAEEVGGRSDQIAFPIDDVAPISVLVGKTRLIADRLSNSIIVMGTKEAQGIVLDIIERLDKRQPQVYLATVIGELTLSDDTAFGIDYLQKFIQFDGQNINDGGITSQNINARSDVIGATNTTGNIADVRDAVITTAFGPTGGLNIYGQIGEQLDVLITALESTDRFKVLSRPVVYTQNGKRAEITSGQEVPVPATTLSDTNNVNAVQTSIDFKEVVLKLEVLPTISSDRKVTLDIVQINDRVVGQQAVANNVVPIIGKQELNTTVTVPDRTTIVLGGLISERDDVTDTGVPILKNIPVIGRGLKNTSTTTVRTELMIFIQPIVVWSDTDELEASHDEDVRSKIGEDAAVVFPNPGTPTENYPVEQIEEENKSMFRKLGRRLFGPKPKHEGPYSNGVRE